MFASCFSKQAITFCSAGCSDPPACRLWFVITHLQRYSWTRQLQLYLSFIHNSPVILHFRLPGCARAAGGVDGETSSSPFSANVKGNHFKWQIWRGFSSACFPFARWVDGVVLCWAVTQGSHGSPDKWSTCRSGNQPSKNQILFQSLFIMSLQLNVIRNYRLLKFNYTVKISLHKIGWFAFKWWLAKVSSHLLNLRRAPKLLCLLMLSW